MLYGFVNCSFFFFFFFSLFFSFFPPLLSGPYLRNRYSRSNFALLLTFQFASLISSLINVISLLLTTFHWTKVRGIAPRSHTGRPRTCLVNIIISDPRRGCYIVLPVFIFFFSATFFRAISLEPLLAETPN